MRKLTLAVCLTFAFFVASAAAQMAPGGGSQGTQNSSPTMQQPGQQPGGMNQPDTNTPAAQTDQNTSNQNHNNMGEKKLKGCVQSEGGQYMLETKKGKTVAVTGQDLSAHVGHEVSVKGTWENGMSATSSGGTSGASSGKTFNVTEVKMISDTCSGKGAHKSGSTGSESGNGTGTGTGPQ